MSEDQIGLGNAQPAKRAKQQKRRATTQPVTGPTPDAVVGEEYDEVAELRRRLAEAERAAAAEPVKRGVPIDLSGDQVEAPAFTPPVNPYAPTGWQRKQRVEFDLELPSGQLCRVMRLERDDLLRLNLMEHLDTFTPMLMDQSMSDEAREAAMTSTVQENPQALKKMLNAVDKVVMAACVRPQITEDESRVNYGTEKDWANPNFTATVHIDNIDTFERMYIFGAAFGRSMDDLKVFSNKRKAWTAWQISQAYNKPPSYIYGIHGAAGLFLDIGIFIFGRWVESEVQEAESSASNKMFANMYRARAFARCMGDDMETSTAGFADPFTGGAITTVDSGGNRKRRKPTDDGPDGEVLWDEQAG
ncbi:tail assembly chaperone [Mycobacterium phage Onyinye]|uniref:Tail assembly chaperone n=1 Tax=Mycobacterium phage Onyinye TaxID=2686235 RepID=A0A6B9L6Y1_9CAUD|nr:tail assembly chaperone [Mycobacterium phage Onyinye]QHB37442.1 tail assembly chaperone [Mycobacterium phage Onyinye]